MRKSTLITTIAMIVVVVVALSTATFAWFSSASNTIATASVQTQADAHWSIVYVKPSAPALATTQDANATTSLTGVTLSGAAKNNVTLTSPMLGGLFSPTDVIATEISGSGTSVGISNLATFYDATVNEDASVKCGVVYDGKYEGAQMKMPDILRVSNATQSSKTLKLNIVINVGTATDSSATLLAGAAVRFYIHGKFPIEGADGTVTPSSTTISNSYEYKAGATKATNFGDTDTETKAAVGGITGELDYATAATGEGYAAAEQPDSTLGIAAGEHTKTYTITIGKIPKGQAANFVIYTWIDGWTADAAAAGAALTVKYAFTSEA